jgi:methylase of polypeptide subunit release factors
MDIIRQIYAALPEVLVSGGELFMEIGADQGEAVQSLFLHGEQRQLFNKVEIYQDYAGYNRIVYVQMM